MVNELIVTGDEILASARAFLPVHVLSKTEGVPSREYSSDTTTADKTVGPSFATEPHEHALVSPTLLGKRRKAIQMAREYRQEYGDPIENLTHLLEDIAQGDEETWRAILDEPYG